MTELYSAHEKKQGELICSWLKRLTSPDSIYERLEQHGFEYWTAGGFKRVYTSKKFRGLVVKVYMTRSGYDCDSTPDGIPERARSFFLTPLVHTPRFMIQKRCNHKGGSPRKAENAIYRKLRGSVPNDVSEDNCAFHNGTPYFFDYCS